MDIQKLKYPIGRYSPPSAISMMDVQESINELFRLPVLLSQTANLLSDEQLDTAYRPEGWTLRQVIHHLADSHMNAYIRFKLAVTESNPIIKPYHEDRWAECADAKHAPIETSLKIISSLHARWVLFLNSLTPDDWEKEYTNPETEKHYSLKFACGMYAWHGKHHLAHITETINSNNW